MKKFLSISVFIFAVSFAADNSAIFTGVWCVENENMNITFIGKDSVRFWADDDASVNGSGRYSFNDSLLIAELENSGMKMKITYKYSKTDKGVKAATRSLIVNADTIKANPNPIFLTRCAQNSKKGSK
ncbi:MAG: hypothetical protein LBH98_10510 [Chitinispirillales bacterium]|jgi:hypothetical protein|nr:hypothetical protein [Chitinispirillales bacterium]